jgi:Glucose / Sorbosone dehydrogenase
LVVHPNFPEDGFAFLQGENARDLPDPLKPNEEINALEKGNHYGWPYCYDIDTASPGFRAVLQSRAYKDFCNDKTAYHAPLTLMPPHAAPLGMLYYHGDKFPELKDKLLVDLHGYRPTGGRVIFYDVDAKGFPIVAPPPVIYHVSCAADPTRAFQTEKESQVAAAPYNELVTEWHKVLGVRPQGAPVGLTVASDGAIWLVEDKNQSIIRIDHTSEPPAAPLPCTTRTDKQIAELAGYVAKDKTNSARLRQIRTELIEKHCAVCHAGFGLKDGQSDTERDMAALRFMLGQDSWIYPGDPNAGRLHTRMRGLGGEKIMPPVEGETLIKQAGYRALLDKVDALIATMVPGKRMRVRGGRVDRVFFSRGGKECGTIPTGTVVVMVEKAAKNKPGFSRIYRPADLYLNGDCSDDDGYYLEQNNLVPL